MRPEPDRPVGRRGLRRPCRRSGLEVAVLCRRALDYRLASECGPRLGADSLRAPGAARRAYFDRPPRTPRMIAWAICVPAERAADWTADRMASSPGDMRWRLPETVFPPNSPPINPASISVHPPDDEAAEPASASFFPSPA